MTTTDAPVTVEREAIERAIKATEYKYFGDYEMSDDQREAVDVLVQAARHRLAALASAPAGDGVVQQVKDILRGPDGEEYTDHGMEDAFFRWPVIERAIAAALARPRAAVGEQSREAIEAVIHRRFPNADAQTVIATAREVALALQSPPAKVEG